MGLEIFLHVTVLILGFAFLIKGADYFVDGAAGIASRFGVPQIIIGLTIVAIGTSAPEAAVSIAAAAKGSADITIGNIVGSNILNVLLVLGITAIIRPLVVEKSTLKIEMPFVVVITMLLFGLGFDGTIARIDGIILWVIFIVFMVYLIWKARSESAPSPEDLSVQAKQEDIEKLTASDKPQAADAITMETVTESQGQHVGDAKSSNFIAKMRMRKSARPLWVNLVLTLVGLAMIILGSVFAVDSASQLARIFGLSERFIGLTIVALGTSLPELVTSAMAAIKGNADIAIGNIVGSNIFNILFVVGTSALIIPVPFAPSFRIDTLIAAATALLLLLVCIPKKRISRPVGLIFVACYAAYFIYLIH